MGEGKVALKPRMQARYDAAARERLQPRATKHVYGAAGFSQGSPLRCCGGVKALPSEGQGKVFITKRCLLAKATHKACVGRCGQAIF